MNANTIFYYVCLLLLPVIIFAIDFLIVSAYEKFTFNRKRRQEIRIQKATHQLLAYQHLMFTIENKIYNWHVRNYVYSGFISNPLPTYITSKTCVHIGRRLVCTLPDGEHLTNKLIALSKKHKDYNNKMISLKPLTLRKIY